MCKKILLSKLNSEKGITAADSVIALLIILLSVGIISMTYINLRLNSKEIERKTGATRIATNIIENFDQIYYSDIDTKLNSYYDSGILSRTGSLGDYIYTANGGNNIKIFDTSIPVGYTALIENKSVNASNDIVRKITVQVKYTVDNNPKKVEVSKVFEKENVRECNSPQFTEEYIRGIIPSGYEYQIFSVESVATLFGMQSGIKIICPIQLDKTTNKYKVIDVSKNQLWYSYSNKNWARILVLDSGSAGEFNTYVNNTTYELSSEAQEMWKNSEYSYLWIPRFGVKNGGELFGGTYFKYKSTNYPIVSSYYDGSSMIANYLKMDITENWWSTARSISFNNDENVGEWINYSTLNTTNSNAYYLNNSQFGPIR